MNTMNDYTIYCTQDQAVRALKLGAPIDCVGDFVNGDKKASKVTGNRFAYNLKVYKIPTAEQMKCWMHGCGVYPEAHREAELCSMPYIPLIVIPQSEEVKFYAAQGEYGYAILTAINAALYYLEKEETK